MSKYLLLIIVSLFPSTEEIPMLMWETNQEFNLTVEQYSLPKMKVSDFRSKISQTFKRRIPIIVYLEDTLSLEDLIIRNENGGSIYLGLSSFMKSYNSYFIPNMDDPFGLIEEIASPIQKINIHNMIHCHDVGALVIDLNDINSDDSRITMLKKHDLTIFKTQLKLLEQYSNLLNIFTARYPSWIPENSEHYNFKKLLQVEHNSSDSKVVPIVDHEHLLLVMKESAEYSTNYGEKFDSFTLRRASISMVEDLISVRLIGGNINVRISTVFGSDGFWKITEVTIDENYMNFEPVEVPMNFSYHCSKFELYNRTTKQILRIHGFQIQPFKDGQDKQSFGDSYDCVGFMTIPIWSGIFVVAILMIILFCGLLSLMDIQTRDGFDDPRGNLFKPFVENS